MTDAEHHRKLERLYAAAPVSQWYGASIAIADGQAEVRMATRPVRWWVQLLGHIPFVGLPMRHRSPARLLAEPATDDLYWPQASARG